MRQVILDTDIGTDVDDLLALVFLAHARELSLKGVTTVYGDTLLRARMKRPCRGERYYLGRRDPFRRVGVSA